MFALAFDFDIGDLEVHYGPQIDACNDVVREFLELRGFDWVQDGLYHLQSDDMGPLFQAIQDLTTVIGWFSPSIRNLRAFKVEQWSDFTRFMKNSQ